MSISAGTRKVVTWSTAAVVALVAAWGALGGWYAPGFLRKQAVEWVRANYGRTLAIGKVSINPFLLKLTVDDLALPDADGGELLGWKHLLVDFEASSLWRRALVFRELTLEGPRVRVVRRADGRINLADLALPKQPGEPEKADEPPPRMWIRDLAVTAGDLRYVDARGRSEALQRHVAPITFRLQDFRTTAEGGQFQLAGRSTADEAFEWRGRFALAPEPNASGDFSIARLRLAGLWEFLPATLPAVARNGLIDLSGSYALALADVPQLTLRLPRVAIADAAIGPRDAQDNWISARGIALEGIAFDFARQSLQAERLRVDAPQVTAWLAADGKLNLARLWESTAQAAASSVAATPVPAAPTATDAVAVDAPAAATQPWKLGIGAVELTDAGLDFEDRRDARPHRFKLAPLAITTGAVSGDLAQAFPVTLDATLNGRASLHLQGELAPAPLSASLQVKVDQLPLALLKPYVLPKAALTIRGGMASTDGRLAIQSKQGAPLALGYDGNVQLAGLATVDDLLQEDLLNLRLLSVRKLHYSSRPARLTIGSVAVVEPYARLLISPEWILNVSAVLDPEAAAAKRALAAAARDGKAPAQEAVEEPGPEAPAAAPAPATPASESFPIRISEVALQRARLNFTDLSIRPNFSAEIQELTGSVKGLSSAADSRAAVDLKGNLGQFSPVTISGDIQPFAFARHTDIAMNFGNIALPVFNPYSGTFAGYNIAKGKLDTELRYEIEGRQLKASHHIRIDQLEWGDASEFKAEATLPVKFATALLRDRHGVIDLDLPVTGSLDDPKFRIGPIIWQVIKNVIVKAATAPFALLGSLFKGAEEAQYVRFMPGDATLDPAIAANLAQLAKGLAEREGVSLDVPLATLPELDRPALLERRVAERLATAPPKVQKDAEALAKFEAQLRATIAVSDGDLEALSQQRANAVQQALLASGELTPARVFVVGEGKVVADNGQVQLQLGLK